MLSQLSIRNFALIERADIRFNAGYTAITGETGSGKSILLGALNLILGERADYSVIRDSALKTIVEAHFHLNEVFKSWFIENDVDWEEETLIRREITSQGKSRAFINDTPVQLNQLRELTEQLIYIHSQHQTLEIKKSHFQFQLLDAFGDTVDLFTAYTLLYQQYKQSFNERAQLLSNQQNFQKEMDFLRFQLEELEQMKLSDHSFESYEAELNRLGQLDDLRSAFMAVSEGIGLEGGPTDQIRSIKAVIDKWKSTDQNLEVLSERLNTCLLELDDIAEESAQQLEALEMNPERLVFLTEMVDRFNHLLRKHGLRNQSELMQLEASFSQQLEKMDASDEKIEQLNQLISKLETQARELANELYQKRMEASVKLSQHLAALMGDLKLPDARIRFELQPKEQLDTNGGMSIFCLFSANAGMELKAIDKAASGGELSRLMLAIQATMSSKTALPTLILDEIDTGVSGEVALRIGKMLASMGENMQLFAITHLPQVAAKATHHFEVSKSSTALETNTSIVPLAKDERIIAIAKLLSGDEITAISKENASHLLQ